MTHLAVFDEIKKIVRSTKFNCPTDNCIQLEEQSVQATLRKLLIKGVGDSAFALKYDESGFPSKGFFVDSHATLHKGCDAIVFCELDGKPYILFCELKSSEPNDGKVKHQLLAANCFIECLSVILVEHCKKPAFSDWGKRFIVFRGRNSLEKTPTRTHVTTKGLTHQEPRFISVSNEQKLDLADLLSL
jgi:hypothetical protein